MFAPLRKTMIAAAALAGLVFAPPLQARMLVVGTISDEPIKETRTFRPFAQHLARQMADSGITGGEVRIAQDISHMARLMESGAVDLYIDSPLVSLAVNRKSGSRMIARRWKKGVADYKSVIFARRDSGISSLDDLANKVLAFEEEFSSSGYLLPRLSLMEDGVGLTELDGPRAEPPAKDTGYVFSGDDENTFVWVLHGLVDAGAMSLNGLKKTAGSDFATLTLISQTSTVPRHVVSLAPGIPGTLADAVQKVLLQMDQNSEGAAVLNAFEKTTKFDMIPPETKAMLEQYQAPVSELIGR